MQWHEVAFNTGAASTLSLYPRYALYLLIQTHRWLSSSRVLSEVKLIDINIFIIICQGWNRGKRLVPFRLLTFVWRQGSLLSRVNLPLLLYKVTGDVVADNILVIEGMNRGFGSWSLLVVLLGKRTTNNLGIICSTPPPFSINYSFYWFVPGRQTNFNRRQSDTLTSHSHTLYTKQSVYCVCGMCKLHLYCKHVSFMNDVIVLR